MTGRRRKPEPDLRRHRRRILRHPKHLCSRTSVNRSIIFVIQPYQEDFTVNVQSLIIFLVIGAVAGWLAGLIMKGSGFGLLGNIVVGIIGAVVGGFVFGLLGLAAGGLIGSIVTATVGAVVLLFLIGLIKKG
jgi:uncharacterized membrane protein YeaQ/YmgE (transglycosylase-associated protein family)